MKTFLLFVLIPLTIQINAQNLFDNSQVRTFTFTFYNTNWDLELDNYVTLNKDTMIPAKLVVDNITYDSVGVQYYSNSAYNVAKLKNPIKIKMNEFIKGQNLYGFKEFKLSNMYKDPSCVREVVMYEVYRKYLPASQSGYVNMIANGISYGLFTSIETVSDDFLNDNYNTDLNTLVDCGEPNIFVANPAGCTAAYGILPSSLLSLGADSTCYSQSYELKSIYGWSDLAQLINTLNNNSSQLSSQFNIDRALWMLALNNIFVNLDSYTGSGDNYYLYKDEYNIFNVVPKNLNRSLGVYAKGGVTGALDLTYTEMMNLSPSWNISNPNHPLIKALLSNADLYKRYLAHYRTIYTNSIANDGVITRATALNTLIDLNAQFDTYLLYGYPNFMTAVNQTVVSGKNAYIGIKILLDGRKTYLSALPEIKLVGPTISKVTELINEASSKDTTWITATISNVTTATIGIKYHKHQPYAEQVMYDDGKHHDTSAGDGIYGIGIPPQLPNSKVYYYIYAENSSAGKFSPETAAYDEYSYRIEPYNHPAGDIVINEFMASNVSTLADAQGQYDDWIELYNNTSNSISLKNYQISDNTLNAPHWTFPDTSITANSYLILWMDTDTLATGLHANFNLSKNDGLILLRDNNNVIIDSLSYVKQNADTSYGRYPNGTGNFRFMPPSAKTSNLFFNSITKIDNSTYPSIEVWPNPATTAITIKVLNNENYNQISIYNLTQQKIKEYYTDKNSSFINCNISDISPGIYFIRYAGSTTKFIKY